MGADEARQKASGLHTYLEVTGPNGESFSVDVPEGSARTVGRNADSDIVLRDDPLVSRVHCTVLATNSSLEVTDNGSTNGTLVHVDGEWRWVRSETVVLGPGDKIRISGRPGARPNAQSSPGFWDLTFQDPFATQAADPTTGAVRLEFAWTRNKVFRVEGAQRKEVPLLPGSQEYKLLRYMDERNVANHNTPVDCTHDELIAAIWEGDQAHGHTPNDIAHLVRDLRARLEPRPENPRLIVTVRGGYRLVSQPLPEWHHAEIGSARDSRRSRTQCA